MNVKLFLAIIVLGCNSTIPAFIESGIDKSEIHSEDYQVSKDSLIMQLADMSSDELNCDADVYWKIIKKGKEYIPILIESLTDTTLTNVTNPCKKEKLNIGEISYFALESIADFPTFLVTKIQFDFFHDDCWNFYDFLFDNQNKPELQKMMRDFYNQNTYRFVKFKQKELNDCQKKYTIEGRYKLIRK